MLKIDIQTIPHKSQRYETPGDYYKGQILSTNDRTSPTTFIQEYTVMRVSDLGNSDYEFLIAMHELIEMYLTEKRGIKEEDIKRFDQHFEDGRKLGLHTEDEEAGDDPHAPYRKEHFFATNIERMIASELGVDWEKYDEAVTSLLKE